MSVLKVTIRKLSTLFINGLNNITFIELKTICRYKNKIGPFTFAKFIFLIVKEIVKEIENKIRASGMSWQKEYSIMKKFHLYLLRMI